MYLKELYIDNYRNLCKQKIEFVDGVNILYGLNAQGKSNLLESIRLLSVGKSFRNSKNNELIRFGEEYFYLKAIVVEEDDERKIEISFKRNENRNIKINGNRLKNISELLGNVLTVVFSPEDLNIIKQGPSIRRRYIDSCISVMRKSYLFNIIQYNKILNNRNKILKNIKISAQNKDILDIFNEQLIDYGSKIILTRQQYINNLQIYVKKILSEISNEDIELKYLSNININSYDSINEIKQKFNEKLKKDITADIRYCSTQSGPHRDDIKIIINGYDSRIYSSQGQQRTAALCLKLAEFEMLKKETGKRPILLLDDVMSELDLKRQMYILKKLSGVQAFITHTNKNDLHGDKFFEIAGGVVKAE